MEKEASQISQTENELVEAILQYCEKHCNEMHQKLADEEDKDCIIFGKPHRYEHFPFKLNELNEWLKKNRKKPMNENLFNIAKTKWQNQWVNQ